MQFQLHSGVPEAAILNAALRRLDPDAAIVLDARKSRLEVLSTANASEVLGALDAVGCVGVCVETWMGFDERRRIDMQREVVRHFLDSLGILPFASVLTAARPTLA